MANELSPRQLHFISIFWSHRSAKSAAAAAGYRTGSEHGLLTNPRIRKKLVECLPPGRQLPRKYSLGEEEAPAARVRKPAPAPREPRPPKRKAPEIGDRVKPLRHAMYAGEIGKAIPLLPGSPRYIFGMKLCRVEFRGGSGGLRRVEYITENLEVVVDEEPHSP